MLSSESDASLTGSGKGGGGGVQDFGIMDITAERLEVLIKVVKQTPHKLGSAHPTNPKIFDFSILYKGYSEL